MMKQLIYFAIASLLLFTSCQKEAGEGGRASIRGIVWTKEYNGNFSKFLGDHPTMGEYVYIHYGDEISYSKRIRTSYDGRFEFKYLRPGKYKLYCFSKDPSDTDNSKPHLKMAVIEEIEITKAKEVVELDTLFIYDN